jgi:hypothetical protein
MNGRHMQTVNKAHTTYVKNAQLFASTPFWLWAWLSHALECGRPVDRLCSSCRDAWYALMRWPWDYIKQFEEQMNPSAAKSHVVYGIATVSSQSPFTPLELAVDQHSVGERFVRCRNQDFRSYYVVFLNKDKANNR